MDVYLKYLYNIFLIKGGKDLSPGAMTACMYPFAPQPSSFATRIRILQSDMAFLIPLRLV